MTMRFSLDQLSRKPLPKGMIRYLGWRPDLEACIYAIRHTDGLAPARLGNQLAAADDLLSVCKAMLAAAKCNYDPVVIVSEYGRRAEAAIAKAERES